MWRSAGVRFVGAALAFGAVALLPYSFLTYMPRVPSRHTYLASVALAIVVGAALTALAPRLHGWRMTALVLVVVLHNCGYLWIYKQKQYLERAMPTVELVNVLRSTTTPVLVECFPYSKSIALQAATIAARTNPDRLLFRDSADCTTYRFMPLPVTNASLDNHGRQPAAPVN
jgi:hypothetical protein